MSALRDQPCQSIARYAMKLSLREILLLLLIVPLIGLWIADKASDRKRDAANQKLIDHYRWRSESLEESIRFIEDVTRVDVEDDIVDIELRSGSRITFHNTEYDAPPLFNSNWPTTDR